MCQYLSIAVSLVICPFDRRIITDRLNVLSELPGDQMDKRIDPQQTSHYIPQEEYPQMLQSDMSPFVFYDCPDFVFTAFTQNNSRYHNVPVKKTGSKRRVLLIADVNAHSTYRLCRKLLDSMRQTDSPENGNQYG